MWTYIHVYIYIYIYVCTSVCASPTALPFADVVELGTTAFDGRLQGRPNIATSKCKLDTTRSSLRHVEKPLYMCICIPAHGTEICVAIDMCQKSMAGGRRKGVRLLSPWRDTSIWKFIHTYMRS